MSKSLRIALVAGVGLLFAPAAATANPYTVFSCKGPAGQPLEAAGWAQTRGGDMLATNTCAAGGSLALAFTGPGPWPGGSTFAQQQFSTPAGTAITGLTVTRRIVGLTSAQKGITYRFLADTGEIEACDPANGRCTTNLEGPVTAANLNVSTLRLELGCAEFGVTLCTNSGQSPSVDIPQTRLTLNDPQPPTVTNVQGNLPGAGAGVRGSLTVTFNAADIGSGVYRTITNVDGALASVTPAQGGTCTDLDPSNADAYEFSTPVPCPLQVAQLTASVDTTKLTNGAHTVDVFVEDASGNRTPVVGSRSITVDNPPPPGATPAALPPNNGTNASVRGRVTAYFVATRNQRTTTRFGRRVVIRGRLVNPNGRAIQGARLDVYHRFTRGGRARRLLKTGLKSREAGRITLILPLNLTTRSIQIAYRARRPGPITSSQTLRLTVRNRAGRIVREQPPGS